MSYVLVRLEEKGNQAESEKEVFIYQCPLISRSTVVAHLVIDLMSHLWLI
uniref:Uncharacterized protein n=1 Tax=Rhizophora mucronata TaxID=61149 RepID=A0A2P2PFQ9_RHIMU